MVHSRPRHVYKLFQPVQSTNFSYWATEQQFGFRKLHSTISVVLNTTNGWYVNMDRKMFILVDLLNLKKDSIKFIIYSILFSNLKLYSITESALCKIRSYLSVATNKKMPGGSHDIGAILGLHFFLIYITDLPGCLNHASADDINFKEVGLL